MDIRNAAEADLNFISRLEIICWGNKGATFEDFKEFLKEQPKSSYLQILHSENESLGFIGYSYNSKTQNIDIWNLAITPEYRRKNLGKTLILHVISFGKNAEAKSISLKVSENNVAALKLYNDLDFKIVSETANYYGPGESCRNLKLIL